MSMRSIVKTKNFECSFHRNTGCIGWNEDNGVPFVRVWVIMIALGENNIQFASGAGGTTNPPFLDAVSSVPR